MNNLPQGSIWRKWDLHIHTKYSLESRAKLTVRKVFENAVKHGMSVISITEHNNVDSLDEIWDVWENGEIEVSGENRKFSELINFLPGIELRTDKGKHSVHLISIFPKHIDGKKVNKNFLKEDFLSKIKASTSDIEKSGNGDYSKGIFEHDVDFEETAKRVKELGGITIVHSGTKSNGIEKEMAHAKGSKPTTQELLNSLGTRKVKLMKNYIDICEVPNNDQNNLIEAKFYLQKFLKPTIVGSDSHETYKGKKFTWIKADPTFKGLKQIVNEPEERVYIGKTPPKLVDIDNHKEHYIDSISLKPVDDNQTNPWFNNEIPLNSGLVAIIGKKGSGKSALADSVALTGKSHADPAAYSFLRGDKFKKKGLAKQYKAVLAWHDGIPVESNLNDHVSLDTEPEQVKYLPQKFVETVCNESGVALFQQEIDKVIFSYVPEESREDTTNLKGLIKLKTGLIDINIENLRQKVSEKNSLICELEDKKLPSYLNSLKKKLNENKRKLKNLTKPKKAAEPKSKPSKEVEEKIVILNTNLEEIEKQIAEKQQKIKEVNQHITKVQNIKIALDSVERQLEEFLTNYQEDLTLLGIDSKKLITVKINKIVVVKKKTSLTLQRDKLNILLSEEGDDKSSLIIKKGKIQGKLKKIFDGLDKENNAYRAYKKALKDFKDKKKLIKGSKDDTSLNTINSLENEIKYVKEVLINDIESAEQKRDQIVIQVYDNLLEKIYFYKEVYAPLEKIISDKKAKQKKTGSVLGFDVGIVFDRLNFPFGFLDFIDQSRDGTFQGKAEGSARLREIISSSNLKTKQGITDFVKELIDCLRIDKSEKKKPVKLLDDQLIKGSNKKYDLYNYLYGLKYLKVKYTITFNGKDLNENEFSPGEIGALLLIFYLLIDKDKIPLIIDQPEENLDNESIFTLLVPYIKQAKKERQIIIVTHNPNLAVVCDAEQIIYAKMNKRTNQIRYTSGSIENPSINKNIIDVLEGTFPAFQKRDQKYLR